MVVADFIYQPSGSLTSRIQIRFRENLLPSMDGWMDGWFALGRIRSGGQGFIEGVPRYVLQLRRPGDEARALPPRLYL